MKSGYIVIGIVLVFLVALGFTVSKRAQNANEKGMILAVQKGLENIYDQATKSLVQNAGSSSNVITRQDLEKVLTPFRQPPLTFPSFVNPSDIFLPAFEASVSNGNLMCVVRVDNSFYGIDGRRIFRRVTDEEFQRWPHMFFQEIPGK